MNPSIIKNPWIEAFGEVNFDVDYGNKLTFLYPDLPFSDVDKKNISYLSIPDSTMVFKRQEETHVYVFCLSDYFVWVHFIRTKSSTSERGVNIKSFLLFTRHPFPKFYKKIIKLISPKYFDSPDKTIFLNHILNQLNKWPTLKINCEYTHLLLMNYSLKYKTPNFAATNYSNYNTNGTHRCMYERELNIYRVLQSHMLNVIRLWELVITAEPLIVISPSPKICSNAVLALTALIQPVHYNGRMLPYFTINHSLYKHFLGMGKKQGFESTLIGCTNPFFLKSYENWPNILTVGRKENMSNKRTANYINISGKRNSAKKEKLVWEYKEVFVTKRKQFIISNKSIKNLNLVQFSKRNRTIEKINNEAIRKFFMKLTNKFLYPLEKCYEKLRKKVKYFFIKSECEKKFNSLFFYNYVKETRNYKTEIFKKVNHKKILEFYKKFIFSVNFASWLNQKIKIELFNSLFFQLDVKELISNKNEIQIMDLFLRIKADMETHEDHSVRDKLTCILKSIIDLSPDDVKEPMMNHLNKIK